MIFHILMHAHAIGMIIFLSLVMMSLISWVLFIYTWRRLRVYSQSVAHIVSKLSTVRTAQELIEMSPLAHNTIMGRLIAHVLRFRVQTKVFDLEYQAEVLIDYAQRFVSYIKIVAEIGTLVGLFGTVYGLIHAFERIGQQHSADITVVAPGIAEALITTLMGLVVAIPALVMYSLLIKRVYNLERDIYHGVDYLVCIAEATRGDV